MTAEPLSHQEAETKNRALWDEIAPVHLKAYKEVALLRPSSSDKTSSAMLCSVSGTAGVDRAASRCRHRGGKGPPGGLAAIACPSRRP